MDKGTMRLEDILQLVGKHAADQYMMKRAGMLFPMAAVGLQLPETLGKVEKNRRTLDQALGENIYPVKHAGFGQDFIQSMSGARGTGQSPPTSGQMGGHVAGGALSSLLGGLLSSPGKAIGQRVERWLGPPREYGDVKDPAHIYGQATITQFGKSTAIMGAELLKDMASKAIAAVGHMGDNSARNAIIDQLKHEDPVLAEADDKQLMEAYHTMVRFAPTLSTDKNAVRSFLRQAVMSGSGPDFMSIKLLADSEHAVVGDKE